MADRLKIHQRNYTLPDLSNQSRTSSPLFMSAMMAHKSDAHLVLPPQAFVPIKDNFSATHKETKQKELDLMINQQIKMQEKLKNLESSNQHLLNEINNLKKHRETSNLDGQTEHALRNATDMTLYLTKKLQNMHEAITKMEVRVDQQDKTLQQDRTGVAVLANKIEEIEAINNTNREEKMSKRDNDLSAFRDSLQDLRKRFSDEQNERKINEQKIIERLNRQKEELSGLSNKQQNMVTPLSIVPMTTNNKRLEERISYLEDEISKKQLEDKKRTVIDHSLDIEKINNEIVNMKNQLEVDRNKSDAKKWAEFKKDLEEDPAGLHKLLKFDRVKNMQEFKNVKDSLTIVADRQVDHHKLIQEKLQSEILTRQQLERDTLRQLTKLDDKLMKISSSIGVPNTKSVNSGKSEMMIREMESLKKLIMETEKNLEQKIEDSLSKLKPLKSPLDSVQNAKDFAERNEIAEMDRKVERLKKVAENNSVVMETMETWKVLVEKNMKELRRDLDLLKTKEKQSVNNDNQLLMDLNKKIVKLDESVDDYIVFKNLTNNSIEDLQKQMKHPAAQEKPIVTPTNKEKRFQDNEYSITKEWKERVDVDLDEIHRNIKTHKDQILQHDLRLNSLKKEIDSETRDRVGSIDELRGLLNIKGSEKIPQIENRSNSAKEGLKKLANALQGTKNILAMKMQQEMKERENVVNYLTKRLEDVDSTMDEMDDRIHKLENESKQIDGNPRSTKNSDARKIPESRIGKFPSVKDRKL